MPLIFMPKCKIITDKITLFTIKVLRISKMKM